MNYKNHANDHDFFKEDHIKNFLRNHRTGVDNFGRQALGRILAQYDTPTVLDVACGSCVNYETWRLMGVKHQYTGFDLTQKLLDEAQRRYEGLTLVKGYAQELSQHFQPASQDVVIIRHFLEHVANGEYQDVVKQAFDIAKKELIIVFFLEPHGNSEDLIEWRPSNIEGHPEVGHYWCRYSNFKLMQFFSTLGAKIERGEVYTPGAAHHDTIFRIIK